MYHSLRFVQIFCSFYYEELDESWPNSKRALSFWWHVLYFLLRQPSVILKSDLKTIFELAKSKIRHLLNWQLSISAAQEC